MPYHRGGTITAVSVPTETAGHKISMGTQGDSDFPPFKDRGKRSIIPVSILCLGGIETIHAEDPNPWP